MRPAVLLAARCNAGAAPAAAPLTRTADGRSDYGHCGADRQQKRIVANPVHFPEHTT